MPQGLNVLFLAAEAEPFIKVGGLGDVAGSLPRSLRSLSVENTSQKPPDVRLVLPLHKVIQAEGHGLRLAVTYSVRGSSGPVAVQAFVTEVDGMPAYLLAAPPIGQIGSVYSSEPSQDAGKYVFFTIAALELTRALGWPVNIIHANDWHTALACYAVLLGRREGRYSGVATVLTIHNLPFTGPDVRKLMESYAIPKVQTGLPSWASARPLALGLWAADAIVAVSPSYAQEILTRKFGAGLDAYLRARRDSLFGILNGIDVDSYNPVLDHSIAANFGVPTLDRRRLNKTALQQRLGLPPDADSAVIGVVSRLDTQKGIDLLPEVLRRVGVQSWQATVLGTGSPRLERTLKRLEKEFPSRVRVDLRYDAVLARQIYAGADALLMPSRYEPCGVAQMIAMRYGCLPIVNAVGGLRDTVVDGRTGFVATSATPARLAAAVGRAIRVWQQEDEWLTMQRAAMSRDFSWVPSAQRYLDLYQSLRTQTARDQDP